MSFLATGLVPVLLQMCRRFTAFIVMGGLAVLCLGRAWGADLPVSLGSVISSAPAAIEQAVLKGDPAVQSASLKLTSPEAGAAWTAVASVPWVKLQNVAGVTPATLEITFEAQDLPLGPQQGTITVTSAAGNCTIPVTLQVDRLTLRHHRSDPRSTKIYAISEFENVIASRAYLVEIDALSKQVMRVLPVGAYVTDLAVHFGDQRAYVPNWRTGSLLAINLATFEVERTYSLPTYPWGQYTASDAYRVCIGGPGRLVVIGRISGPSLFDTNEGVVLSSLSSHSGEGCFDPSGRYFYYLNAINGLRKFDVSADRFEMVATDIMSRQSAKVFVSEDGKRIFAGSRVHDENLGNEWRLDEPAVCISPDGQYAFSAEKMYDVSAKKVVRRLELQWPAHECAYNSATSRLLAYNDFFEPFSSGVLGSGMSPEPDAIIEAPDRLRWNAIPGVTSYRVYLGRSASDVASADLGSELLLGEVSSPSLRLDAPLPAGRTFWRVDFIVAGEIITGAVKSFVVAPVSANVSAIEGATVQRHKRYEFPIKLSSEISGKAWKAIASDPWIKLAKDEGVTPATLTVSLDASQLNVGTHMGSILVEAEQGSFIIPVRLTVHLTQCHGAVSAPGSSTVYALSYSDGPVCFLMEIDVMREEVVRTLQVSHGTEWLGVHPGDRRIYLSDPEAGTITAVGIDTLTVEWTFTQSPTLPALKPGQLSAAGAGRLVVQSYEERPRTVLFDTNNVRTLGGLNSKTGWRGFGASLPSGRYYYNYSAETMTRIRIDSNVLYDAGPTVSDVRNPPFVSENGLRVFSGDRVFSPALQLEQKLPGAALAATADGSIAFTRGAIYSLSAKSVLMKMPEFHGVAVFNSASSKLFFPQGDSWKFYLLNEGGTLPGPALSRGGVVTYSSASLAWSDNALKSGYIVQKRVAGTASWENASTSIGAYASTTLVTGLAAETVYEFRMKAVSPVAASKWSNIVSVTTPPSPPLLEKPGQTKVTMGSGVNIVLRVAGRDNEYTVTGLPAGLRFDPQKQAIVGTTLVPGRFSVVIVATNAYGQGKLDFVLTVAMPSRGLSNARYTGLATGALPLIGTWTVNRSANQFSGTYTCSGGNMTFSGVFPVSGKPIRSHVKGSIQGVELSGYLDWDKEIDQMSLTLYAGEYSVKSLTETGFANTWNAATRPYPKAGVFTSVMAPESGASPRKPEGNGFLTFTIAANGVIKATGETALGNGVSWTSVVPDNFVIPFYWTSGDAILWGLLDTSSDEGGEPALYGSLAWALYENSRRQAYPGGFIQSLDLLGNRFVGGSSLSGVFSDSNRFRLQLGGGGLADISGTITQKLTYNNGRLLVATPNPNQMTLSINPANGIVTGTATLLDTRGESGPVKRTVTFRGVLLRDIYGPGKNGVGGYFLLPTPTQRVRSGWMEIAEP